MLGFKRIICVFWLLLFGRLLLGLLLLFLEVVGNELERGK